MTSFRARVQRLAALLALCASLFATSAAATVLFEYRSTCEMDCANVGLSAGDAVSGLIGFTDDAIALGVALSPDDVTVFDLTIGTLTFDRASLGYAFTIFTGLEPNAFVFQFVSGAPGTENTFSGCIAFKSHITIVFPKFFIAESSWMSWERSIM